jgi:Na+/proline symporter
MERTIWENVGRTAQVLEGALVWLIFSFLLGGIPGFFIGGFTALKLSVEQELLGRGAVAGMVIGGILGVIVFAFLIGPPPHFELL